MTYLTCLPRNAARKRRRKRNPATAPTALKIRGNERLETASGHPPTAVNATTGGLKIGPTDQRCRSKNGLKTRRARAKISLKISHAGTTAGLKTGPTDRKISGKIGLKIRLAMGRINRGAKIGHRKIGPTDHKMRVKTGLKIARRSPNAPKTRGQLTANRLAIRAAATTEIVIETAIAGRATISRKGRTGRPQVIEIFQF